MINIKTSKISRIACSCINIALSVSLLLTSLGCATNEIRSFSSPIPEDIRKNSHSVAIIPAGFTPTTNLLTFAKKGMDPISSALTFGPSTNWGGSSFAIGGASGGSPAILLLLPVYAAITSALIAWGIEGAINAIPEEEMKKIETSVNRVMQLLDMQNTMAENIVSMGTKKTSYRFVTLKGIGASAPDAKPDFTLIKEQGHDLAIEVSVLDIGFYRESGKDPLLSFFMNARIRAFQVNDGTELHSDIFSYTSQKRKFLEWDENSALRLQKALETGYAEIAEAAIEKMFLLYEAKIDSIWAVQMHCMLKPLYPPQISLGFFSHKWEFPKIDSLNPTLKWESFPRDKDREADSLGILNRVSDITYELKVWKGSNGMPEELIYSRSRLSMPEHTMETTLQPEIEYFWTVRAHFKLDGQKRLTKWSHSRIPKESFLDDPCRYNLIPPYLYHGFKISLKG